MSDFSRDRLDGVDDDRLPWLEPVEEEIDEGGGGSGRIIAVLVAGVLIIAILIGGFLWMRGRSQIAASGDGSVIKAPDAYYKERPATPGGMDVGSGDEIVYSASKGNEVESQIDVNGAAETPVNVDRPKVAPPAAVPTPAAARTPPAKPAGTPVTDAPVSTKVSPPVAKPVPPKPKPVAMPAEPSPTPSSGGSTIQLGAFSTEAKANGVWKTLSARFSFLQGLTQSVSPVKSGDKTLYRLRANGGVARDVCAKLHTAGESCTVIG